ncbi:MAG: hypothetical protein A2521_11155 [Deltaproteobacteria bacterium RIFOXYD12_FULL_57_12]|nr:MAG: hypothetical protein A2521_11155 [Deltaproteobacteria bacterium RIFOXYD12_FULL_57_12]
MDLQLPDTVRRLAAGETFRFACHPGVACFTECCRELELALTPYDVLRLRRCLGLSADQFLDRYVVVEKEAAEPLPRLYLAMVDDGRASCPFVSPTGCTVYSDRPGACRIYPVGRAARLTAAGGCQALHVLLREPHCLGFAGSTSFSMAEWFADQELAAYNEANDQVMTILQHARIRSGMLLSAGQIERFLLALYDLDRFRVLVAGNEFPAAILLSDQERQVIATDDAMLLSFGIRWLRHELFGEITQVV